MSHENARLANALAAWEQAKADHAKAWRDPSGIRILEVASRRLQNAFEAGGLTLSGYAMREFSTLSRELVVPLTPDLPYYRGLERLSPERMLFGHMVDAVRSDLASTRAQYALPLSPAPSSLGMPWRLAQSVKAGAAVLASGMRGPSAQPG